MSKKKAVKVKKDKKQVVIAVIQRAHDLIAKRGGWTKGLYARDAKQQNVAITNETACAFCADGALQRGIYDITGNFNGSIYRAARTAIYETIPDGLTTLNDNQKTKRPVLNLFKKTLLRLERAA